MVLKQSIAEAIFHWAFFLREASFSIWNPHQPASPGSPSATRLRWWRARWTLCGSRSPSLSERSATETMTGRINDDVQQRVLHAHTCSECDFPVEIKATQSFNILCTYIEPGWVDVKFRHHWFSTVILSAAEIENCHKSISTHMLLCQAVHWFPHNWRFQGILSFWLAASAASPILSESLQSKGPCRTPEEQEEFWQDMKKYGERDRKREREEEWLSSSFYRWWQLVGTAEETCYVCVCVCVWTQTAMRERRSLLRTCQSSLPPPCRVSAKVLLFDPVSAHLAGEANWVRQMEWKHERRLIPFEDFDDKRNLQQFRVSRAFRVKYLRFAVLCFFEIYTAEPVKFSFFSFTTSQQIKTEIIFKNITDL